MSLIQFTRADGSRAVGVIDKEATHEVKGAASVYALAVTAAGRTPATGDKAPSNANSPKAV